MTLRVPRWHMSLMWKHTNIRGETVGAIGKYRKWLDNESLVLLEGWARDGLTDDQIASNMGISKSTLYDWKNKYSEFSAALKRGKEVVDYQVENALLKNALQGDTTAQIYWLKNRRPDKWRDKPIKTQDEQTEVRVIIDV